MAVAAVRNLGVLLPVISKTARVVDTEADAERLELLEGGAAAVAVRAAYLSDSDDVVRASLLVGAQPHDSLLHERVVLAASIAAQADAVVGDLIKCREPTNASAIRAWHGLEERQRVQICIIRRRLAPSS